MHLVRHRKKVPVVRYYLRPGDGERWKDRAAMIDLKISERTSTP